MDRLGDKQSKLAAEEWSLGQHVTSLSQGNDSEGKGRRRRNDLDKKQILSDAFLSSEERLIQRQVERLHRVPRELVDDARAKEDQIVHAMRSHSAESSQSNEEGAEAAVAAAAAAGGARAEARCRK